MEAGWEQTWVKDCRQIRVRTTPDLRFVGDEPKPLRFVPFPSVRPRW